MTAVHPVAQAVENLVPGRFHKITMTQMVKHKFCFVIQSVASAGMKAHRRSMWRPRSKLVYAMFLLFFMFLTSHVSP